MTGMKGVHCHHVTTQRTARYYSVIPKTEPEHLLLVCHGYAQSAFEFIQEVSPAAKTGQLIIAPEGLSRFYRRGFEGEVVASWMTREDRLEEIRDQVEFLDSVIRQVYDQFGELPVSVLGFSQGVPTVCRWLALSAIRPIKVILWAGMVPEAEYLAPLSEKLSGQIDLVLGDEDPFFTSTRKRHLEEAVSPWFHHARWHQFQGEHRIEPDLLREIW